MYPKTRSFYDSSYKSLFAYNDIQIKSSIRNTFLQKTKFLTLKKIIKNVPNLVFK